MPGDGRRLIGPLLMIVLVVWLGFRITQAVDLSDESYYAVFLVTWLKQGIWASPFLSLHQTAALVVYPAAVLFFQFAGSTDGLILFLRALYVLGALVAASSAVLFLQRSVRGWTPWLAAGLVLAFIPYGIPAPSYNTLGVQATIIALAGCGYAILNRQLPIPACIMLLLVSAAAWAVATLAYPSLLLAVGALFLSLFFVVLAPRWMLLTYSGLVIGFQAAAWFSMIWILTWSRIHDTIVYQGAMAGSFDIFRKLSLIFDIYLRGGVFTLAAAIAIAVGIFRNFLSPAMFAVLMAGLFVAVLLFPPALFVHSHDAVVLAALTGLGLLTGLGRSKDIVTRVVATVYAVSLVAGLATAATATYGLFSFPVGGLFAAILAVVPSGQMRSEPWGSVPGTALLGVLLWASATFYYGERPTERLQRRERISGSVYAGLCASEEMAKLIRIASSSLSRWSAAEETVVVIGRLPGLYLLTAARTLAVIPFPLTTLATPGGLAATYQHYANPKNRPTTVVIYNDPYFEPVNPFGSRFEEWYELADQQATPLGTLSIFRGRPEHR